MAFTITKQGGSPVTVPPTISLTVNLNPQQKSAERNNSGTLVRETLPDKWAVQCEWKFSSKTDLQNWYNFLKTITRENFTMTFPAPTGNDETAVFYISPISAKMWNYSLGFLELKCNFVEV